MFDRLKSFFRRKNPTAAAGVPTAAADVPSASGQEPEPEPEPVTVFVQGASCKVKWSPKLACLTVGKPMWDGSADENGNPVFTMHYEPFSVEECLASGITHVTAAMAGAPESFVARMKLASKA